MNTVYGAACIENVFVMSIKIYFSIISKKDFFVLGLFKPLDRLKSLQSYVEKTKRTFKLWDPLGMNVGFFIGSIRLFLSHIPERTV